MGRSGGGVQNPDESRDNSSLMPDEEP